MCDGNQRESSRGKGIGYRLDLDQKMVPPRLVNDSVDLAWPGTAGFGDKTELNCINTEEAGVKSSNGLVACWLGGLVAWWLGGLAAWAGNGKLRLASPACKSFGIRQIRKENPKTMKS